MNNYDFNVCREFLQSAIVANPDNAEFVKAYVKLIEKKTEFDIAFYNGGKELQKDWEKNQTDRIKAQTEVQKKSIEKNGTVFSPIQ